MASGLEGRLGGLAVSAVALLPILIASALYLPGRVMALFLVAYVGLSLMGLFGRFTQSSVLALASYIALVLALSWGVLPRNPGGVMLLYIPLLLIPLILAAAHLRVLSMSGSQGVSPLFTIGSLPLMLMPQPAPLIGASWALAGGVTAAYEAFSTPWLPPLTYMATYLLSIAFEGRYPWSHVSIAPLGFYQVFVINMGRYSSVSGVSIVFTLAAIYSALPYLARVVKSRASSILPPLLAPPLAFIALVMLADPPYLNYAYYAISAAVGVIPSVAGSLYVSSIDTLSILYGHIAELPDGDTLRRYYAENWLGLIGLDEAKRELILASESFTRARFGFIRPIHGVLLFGPAGTGKTALGLGYAAWLGLYRGFRVIIVRAGRLMRGGPWEAAWRLDRVFALARALQPSVIYIDEVDSIGRAREESGAGGYRLVSVLLQNIDGVTSRYDKVLVVATTNNVEALDEALIRPGRLGDLKIYVAKPKPETVKQIIAGIAQQRGVQIPEWLLEEASKAIETGAEAEALVNCIALKTAAGAWDQNQLKACLAGITKGIQAYS